ncbi:thioesterase II family protein [Streptomyces sp. NPDC018000]|uniref:thioesterase II family protein n=1 Tax=Streptomyces sp. NPDC018000 TaxID=3365028 RepID=UPI0037A2010B
MTSTSLNRATASRWLRRFHTVPRHAPARLLLLPHAGGSASYYFPFSEALAGSLDVLAVQYPGRQERLQEPLVADIGRLADHVVQALADSEDGPGDRPLALFGHSMGALVAYEVACRLQELGTPVRELFLSGRRAASCPNDLEHLHTQDDAALVTELRAMDGTDGEVLTHPELLRLILPSLRADYRAVESYRHRPRPRLTCPVTTLTGDSDPRVDRAQAAAWADHTTGRHELRVFPGGHFYLSAPRQRAAVVELLLSRLVG